jgi:hypothetical protein
VPPSKRGKGEPRASEGNPFDFLTSAFLCAPCGLFCPLRFILTAEPAEERRGQEKKGTKKKR